MNDRFSEIQHLQTTTCDRKKSKIQKLGHNLSSLIHNLSHNADQSENGSINEQEPLLGTDTSTTDSDSSITLFNQEIIANKSESKRNLSQFFKKVTKIKSSAQQINCNMDQLARLKHLILHETSPYKERILTKQLDNLITSTSKLMDQTKKSLYLIKQDTNQFSSGSNFPHSNPELKIKENHLFHLSRNFKDQVQEFRVFQSEYRSHLFSKFSRQIKYIHPEATEVEISSLLENKSDTDLSLANSIVENNSNLKAEISEVISKSSDIKKLERGVIELHQLFTELSEFVESQDSHIDQIGMVVSITQHSTGQSHSELLDLKTKKDTNRNKTIIISSILLLVAAFILIRTIAHITFLNPLLH